MTVVHAVSCSGFGTSCPESHVAAARRDLPRWVVLVTALGVAQLTACHDDAEHSRVEARELLARLNAIEDETSLQARKKQLDQLELLRLDSSDNRAARESCYLAHRGLWQAEVEQATAQKALDAAGNEASAVGPVAAPDKAERGKEAGDAIARSNRALADAQAHFPACEKAMQGLITRAR